jgi:hypothetical protein
MHGCGPLAAARALALRLGDRGEDPAESRLVRTYLASSRVSFHVTEELTVEEPLGRNLTGLLLAEWYQDDGDFGRAIAIVEQLEPTQTAALSLAELYCSVDRFADVVDLTDDVTNVDDVTALLCVYRGDALLALGNTEAARLALKEVLKSRSRLPEVRFRALVQRSAAYRADGRVSTARKDLERIRAEDASYPGLANALARLEGEPDQPRTDDSQTTTVSPTMPADGITHEPVVPPAGPAAGWYADPTGEYQYRYWDGHDWTNHAATNGVTHQAPSTKPLSPPNAP